MNLSIKILSILKYSIVTSLLFLSSCTLDFSNRGTPTDDTGVRAVEVNPAHQVCERASDCVVVYVDCSGCDCGVPVNKKFEDLYFELYDDLCSDYVGAVCEMYCPQATLVCESNICVVEPSQ